MDALEGLTREEAVAIATDGGADSDVIEGVADALMALYEVWIEEDASLTEINPLIVTPDREVKALDAKVSLDDNALFRHPENKDLSDKENQDPIERAASEQGVQYVKLDGDIGILGNGAGLVMSTLDVVAQAGGEPANFLDAGGGSDAEKVKQAVSLILANDAVKAVLFNIFGGITRCDEVANGLVAAFKELQPDVPFVVRLDGTNDVQGREILEQADLPNVHPAKTMLEAAQKVVELATMSVLVDREHEDGHGRYHRPRGQLPHAEQPQLRHQRGRRREPQEGRRERGGHPRLRVLEGHGATRPAPTRP